MDLARTAADVIDLHRHDEPATYPLPDGLKVLQCLGCGSQTFWVYNDGSTECTGCGQVTYDHIVGICERYEKAND